MTPLPTPADTNELEEILSRPTQAAIDALRNCQGDIVILGAGGKMGPSLSRMLQRAAVAAGGDRSVTAVSRFGGNRRATLFHPHVPESDRIIALSRDLTSSADVESLPLAPNVFYLAGQKFGTAGDPSGTWALNAAVPALIANRYHDARIVAFSTGNIYPLTSAASGGSVESDPPGPVGEYAMSCLARERIFSWYSAKYATPLLLFRLNYAVDLRYGVLVDIANRVMLEEPISLSMPSVNVIWQGDANASAIASLRLCAAPPRVLNVTGKITLHVRDIAEQFGALLNKTPRFVDAEGADSLLSNSSAARAFFGDNAVDEQQLILWVADWVSRGGEQLGKPTHFERRDGKY